MREGLNLTAPGLRLRLAWHEAAIAKQKIKLFLSSDNAAGLEQWRRSYIQARERASKEISTLSMSVGWPPETQHDGAYHWRPRAAKPR